MDTPAKTRRQSRRFATTIPLLLGCLLLATALAGPGRADEPGPAGVPPEPPSAGDIDIECIGAVITIVLERVFGPEVVAVLETSAATRVEAQPCSLSPVRSRPS